MTSTMMLFLGEYAKSPKGLKVGDRVRIDVDADRLEELQKERDAWDPELAKVSSFHCALFIKNVCDKQ